MLTRLSTINECKLEETSQKRVAEAISRFQTCSIPKNAHYGFPPKDVGAIGHSEIMSKPSN